MVRLGGSAIPAGHLNRTVAVNVPMYRALLDTTVPEDINLARSIWQAYSGRWQTFTLLRTLVSAMTLGLTAMGIVRLVQAQADART